MPSVRHVLLVVLALVIAGCSNKLTSDVSINGESQEMSSCRSGAVYGFRGVELTAKSGTMLRIASTMTGQATVVVMKQGETTGAQIENCGAFEIADQSSTINDVKNVNGKAVLDCAAGGVSLKGSVTFENCH